MLIEYRSIELKMGHSRTKSLLSATVLAVRKPVGTNFEIERARLLWVETPPPTPHARS